MIDCLHTGMIDCLTGMIDCLHKELLCGGRNEFCHPLCIDNVVEVAKVEGWQINTTICLSNIFHENINVVHCATRISRRLKDVNLEIVGVTNRPFWGSVISFTMSGQSRARPMPVGVITSDIDESFEDFTVTYRR